MSAHPCAAAVSALLAASACGQTSSPDTVTRQTLTEGVVAEVGGERVTAEGVRRIAEARRIDASLALDLAVRDARFAGEARRQLGPGGTRSVEAAGLARAVLESLRDEARARPVSDAEIDALVRQRWYELDRPESVRTVHALVTFKDAAKEQQARAVADGVAEAVRGVADAESFERSAKAVNHEGLELRVERLPPFAADGRVVGPGEQRMVSEFARAAHALREPGDQSQPVRTEFGLHLIMLLERLPERRTSADERRRLLEPVAYERRASEALAALLGAARRATPVELSRATEDLTGRLQGSR